MEERIQDDSEIKVAFMWTAEVFLYQDKDVQIMNIL